MSEKPKPVAWTLLGAGLLAVLGAVWLLARGAETAVGVAVLIPGFFMMVFGFLLLARAGDDS